MIDPSDVTACIVTRGDRDIQPVIDSLIFENVIVWDNQQRPNRAVCGRYYAAEEAKTTAVYYQDDDFIVPRWGQGLLCLAYQPGRITANMPPNHHDYADLTLLGFGSVCDRLLHVEAHRRFSEIHDTADPWWSLAGCDIAFAMITPTYRVHVGRRDLDYAHGFDRVFRMNGYQQAKHRYYEEAKCLA